MDDARPQRRKEVLARDQCGRSHRIPGPARRRRYVSGGTLDLIGRSRSSLRSRVALAVSDMYWLRSPRLDLGSADCWLDDDRENSVRIDGFWNEKSTVGQ